MWPFLDYAMLPTSGFGLLACLVACNVPFVTLRYTIIHSNRYLIIL